MDKPLLYLKGGKWCCTGMGVTIKSTRRDLAYQRWQQECRSLREALADAENEIRRLRGLAHETGNRAATMNMEVALELKRENARLRAQLGLPSLGVGSPQSHFPG